MHEVSVILIIFGLFLPLRSRVVTGRSVALGCVVHPRHMGASMAHVCGHWDTSGESWSWTSPLSPCSLVSHQLLKIGHGGHIHTAQILKLYTSGSWLLNTYQHTMGHSEGRAVGRLKFSPWSAHQAGHPALLPDVEMSWEGLLFLIQTKLPSAHSHILRRLCLLETHLLLICTKAANGREDILSLGQWLPNPADHHNHLTIFFFFLNVEILWLFKDFGLVFVASNNGCLPTHSSSYPVETNFVWVFTELFLYLQELSMSPINHSGWYYTPCLRIRMGPHCG